MSIKTAEDARKLQQQYTKNKNEFAQKLKDGCFLPIHSYVLDLVKAAASEGNLTLQMMISPMCTDKERLTDDLKELGFNVKEGCQNQLIITW